MRGTVGGSAAVAAATALLGIALASGPLYVSSAASEAVQVGLARTCPADAGLVIGVPPFLDPSVLDRLDDLAAPVDHVQTPIRTISGERPFPYREVGGDDDLTESVVLLSRDGQLGELGRDGLAVDVGEVLAPESSTERAGVSTGSRLVIDMPAPSGRRDPAQFTGPDVATIDVFDYGAVRVTYLDGRVEEIPPPAPPAPLELTVAAQYPDIPYLPEPSFWCGLRDLLRPNVSGDLPPMLMLVDAHQFAGVPSEAVFRVWELRPDPDGMTRHDAARLVDDHRSIADTFDSEAQAAFADARERGQVRFARLPPPADPALARIVTQAETVADVVGRTMAPIRLGGAAAAGVLLVGAGVLVARERRRELRLRVVRGEGPATIAGRIGVSAVLPVVAGAAAGLVLTVVGVRLLGPTPELEPGPLRNAALSVVAGAVAALVVVSAVVSVVAMRAVDPPRRRVHRAVPWELAIVVLTVVSYLRLDRVGGVRLVGDDARGGDLLAQAFPLLALLLPLVLLARPLTWLLRRSRRVGGRLPTPVLIGVRRVGAEPATSTAVTLAAALALGVVMIATAMTDSARQLLVDKAETYLGGDEVVTTVEVLDLPAGLTGTVVGRLAARSDGLNVEVLGVDPVTFASAVRYREDGSDSSMADMLESIAVDPAARGDGAPLPALLAGGGLGSTTLETYNREELTVAPVGAADWFPGQHAGSTLVVVDRDALVAAGGDLAEEVWLRDPPPDARERLSEAGFTVRGSVRSGDVFDVISFLAVKWSYSALRAFGIVIGVVIVLAQLLVLDARRRSRQSAYVLTRPMGSNPGQELVATATELSVPLVAGVLLALPFSLVVLAIAVPRFDTLRQLPPPARLVVDVPSLLAALVIAAVAVVALAAIATVGVVRARPMKVMRSGA